MFPGNPNPFVPMPGKIALEIKKGQMPSGQIVEIMKTELSIMENRQMRKEKLFEVSPGMADGTTPSELEDIRECHVCLGLFNKANVRRCMACGRDFCMLRQCQGEVAVSKEERIVLCALCAKENNIGLLGRISRRLWQL